MNKIVKTFLPFLLLLAPLACDSEESLGEPETYRSTSTMSPRIQYRLWCEVLECPVCTHDPKTALKLDIAVCPQEAEGFGCCDLDLDPCVPVGINPDGTCGGIYMWCDDYSTGPSGEMICHDIYGQG